jgi:hypothetical protein
VIFISSVPLRIARLIDLDRRLLVLDEQVEQLLVELGGGSSISRRFFASSSMSRGSRSFTSCPRCRRRTNS